MTQARDGSVQFEKDVAEPFNIDEMISDATGRPAGSSAGHGAGIKRYGVQETYRGTLKRARKD